MVVTHLIQAMPDLAMRLIQTAESPSAVMTAWLLDDTPAAGSRSTGMPNCARVTSSARWCATHATRWTPTR